METTEQKELLRILVTRLYEECGCVVEPMFPKVLIRVLPKEQKRRSIWLPDGKAQNKPTWEAIVLKVYKPFYQKIYLSQARWVKDEPDPDVRYSQKVECAVQPGDHILFPHIEYGTVPVESLDGGAGEYRMIPEDIIIGRVEYTQLKMKPWLENLFMNEALPEMIPAAEIVLKHADVIRKDVVSVTISGR